MCPITFYDGETGQQIRDRIYGHRAKSSVLYSHFSKPGHSLSNMKVIIVNRTKNNSWIRS